MLKRISITGPESTGKSMLAKALAFYFKEPYVPEFAREYLKEKGTNYTLEDVIKIAKGQLELEKTLALKAKSLLFCDTDMLVTKIWSEVVFKTCPEWIEKQFVGHRYNLYLLCYPDIPWEADPLRENPDNRDELFILYKKALKENKLPFKIISGLGTERFNNAVRFVKE